MSSDRSFETILAEMMAEVPAEVDKREGSIIYNALAPAALKLAEAYFIIDNNFDLVFLDTAAGDYLDRKCSEFGIIRNKSTKAIRKGIFTDSSGALMDIPIKSRFRISDITLLAIEKISVGEYKLECEQVGEQGNQFTGIMIPIDNISNLGTATLTDVLIYGENIEDDESLRNRAKTYIANTESDGNINQYLKWASEFSGVGKSKVFPLASGPNTVKISITDIKNQVASTELINSFQKYMDPENTGLGNGKAPIGSKVTVTTGTKKVINVSGTVKLNQGYTQVEGADSAIERYLSSITYSKNTVSYIRLASEILNLPCVADVNTLTINGGTADIPLGSEDIPMVGTVTLGVAN